MIGRLKICEEKYMVNMHLPLLQLLKDKKVVSCGMFRQGEHLVFTADARTSLPNRSYRPKLQRVQQGLIATQQFHR